MKSLELAGPGDVINLVVATRAYPYEQNDESTTLQGRVVHIDEIGVCLSTVGDVITAGFGRDSDYLARPTRGDLFPWNAIKRLTFVQTSDAYEADWRAYLAKIDAFAAAHGDRSPQSAREYREWAEAQNPAELEARLRAASAELVL